MQTLIKYIFCPGFIKFAIKTKGLGQYKFLTPERCSPVINLLNTPERCSVINLLNTPERCSPVINLLNTPERCSPVINLLNTSGLSLQNENSLQKDFSLRSTIWSSWAIFTPKTIFTPPQTFKKKCFLFSIMKIMNVWKMNAY